MWPVDYMRVVLGLRPSLLASSICCLVSDASRGKDPSASLHQGVTGYLGPFIILRAQLLPLTYMGPMEEAMGSPPPVTPAITQTPLT